MFRVARLLGFLAALIFFGSSAWGYGPFNHLCVVDRNWNAIYNQIQAVGPLDESEAVDAVFAGAIADDLGYYPLNSDLKTFTNQVHYIRTGEWVDFLLRSARSQNSNQAVDYAFALGVLSHYAADRMGHYYGTNVVAVNLAAAVNPAGQKRIFGPRMSYERDPDIHTRVEAGFDIISLAGDCSSGKLSDRFRKFLEEAGWRDGEQVARFLADAFSHFYGYSEVLKGSDLIRAVDFARHHVKGLLQQQKGTGPYAALPATSKPDFNAQRMAAKIIDEGDWIEQQIKLGQTAVELVGTALFKPTFSHSFDEAQGLLLSLLDSAAELRKRQDQELKDGAKVAWDDETFLNINLDTNQLSMSGRYDLADCAANQLVTKNATSSSTQMPYPPSTGDLEPFFGRGKWTRGALEAHASTDSAILQAQLERIAGALLGENRLTRNALSPDLAWRTAKLVYEKSPPAGRCPAGPGVVAFGEGGKICIGPETVYWHGEVRALSLLLAASAVARQAKNSPDRELSERREAVESYRLCDTNKSGGYLDPGLCKNDEPKVGQVLPSETCINQD